MSSSNMSLAVPVVLGSTVVWLAIKTMSIGKRETYLPPGPPTVPLLGNLHEFPKTEAHLKLTEWARIYGGIYSLKMGPGTAIVITDVAAVKELMDKRSQSTVDRPPNHMADLVAGGMNMVLSRYTEDWRTLRRASHAILTQQACAGHLPIQRAEASQLLHDCLTTPEKFYTHIRRYSSSVILSVLFGKRAPRFETKEVTDFFNAQHSWEEVLEPGAHPPMDLIPALKHVPEALASWKTLCKKTRKLQRDLYFGLLEETERRIANHQENNCFMEQVLARQQEFGMNRELVGYLGGVLLEGGSDTTSSFLQTLVLGLTAFPDVQKKAQAEIDSVVGSDHAPTPEDFERLPYIQAIIKECHRWRPVAPLAIPHGTIQEETYRGYRIPAGSTIFVNNWGMFHDPEVFERPDDFWPDRFLQNEFGTKPGVDNTDRRNNMAFGSGRRFCPGVHLANNSLMLNTMNLVWAFDFRPATDETGKPIPVDIHDYAKGILTCPNPFKCKITPRSAHHAEIIEHDFAAAGPAFEPFERDLREEDLAYIATQRK
ncbi:O-methylsterigmatocystin oxidoreductase [Rhizoctonia solani]|uniref:O-methylsterigmatocystin oxidoreductase n=1 Tax=Rhizoctonia solani TaxID=456999 RepID=A0A0K6FL76_9AGAM|nr:O-methylsterigmatocystin oxidoreductase [Rhizoctonia solani]